MMPKISVAFFIKSQPCKIGFKCRQAFEIVRGRKEVDVRQRRLHSARLRRIVPPADQRIEPGNLSAAPSQAPHLPSKLFGLAGVVAVRDDQHSRARIDHTARVPTIESREALTDAGAAADTLRHHRKLVHRTHDIAIAQRWRHVRKPRVEDERLRFAEGVHHAMQEADEKRGIKVHRARGVEKNDEAQRLDLAAPPSEVHGRSAMRYIAMDRTPQVEPPPAPADLLAANQPRAHDARKSLGKRMGSRHVGGIGDMAEIGACQNFKARRALPPPAGIRHALCHSLLRDARSAPPGQRTLATPPAPGPVEPASGFPPQCPQAYASDAYGSRANGRRKSRRTAPNRNALRRTTIGTRTSTSSVAMQRNA